MVAQKVITAKQSIDRTNVEIPQVVIKLFIRNGLLAQKYDGIIP